MKKFSKKGFFFLFFFSFLFLGDALLKYYVYTSIPLMSFSYPEYPYGGIKMFYDFYGISFSINHVENLGAAWGFFASYSNSLFYLRIGVVLLLAVYLLFFRSERQSCLPFLLILTGALGNIFDHVLYGHVIDMFYFTFWGYSYPVFNLADVMIVLGIIWMCFSWKGKAKKERKA